MERTRSAEQTSWGKRAESQSKKKRKKQKKLRRPTEYHLDLDRATEQARHALLLFGEAQSWTTAENDALAQRVHGQAAQANIMECSYSRQFGWFHDPEEEYEQHPYEEATNSYRDVGPHGPWAPEAYVDAPRDLRQRGTPDGMEPLGEIGDYKCVAAFGDARVHLEWCEKTIRAPEGLEEFGPDDRYFSGSVRIRREGDDGDPWQTLCRWEYMVEGCQDKEGARGALSPSACLNLAELVSGDEGAGAWRPRDLLQLVWRLCAAPFDWFQAGHMWNVRSGYQGGGFNLRYVENPDEDEALVGEGMSVPGILRVHLLDVAEAPDDAEYLGSDEFPGYALRLVWSGSAMFVDSEASDLNGAVIRSCPNTYGNTANSACLHSFTPEEVAGKKTVLGPHPVLIPTVRHRTEWNDEGASRDVREQAPVVSE